jgi:hypothetical protein
MKKLVIIDGQAGRIGSQIIEQLKGRIADCEIFAIGTNSIATAGMMKAGADMGGTGENSVVVSCRDADVIAGPMGILITDALLGEITSEMSAAIGRSRAKKILVPINKCSVFVAGTQNLPMGELISAAVKEIVIAVKGNI